MIDTQRLTDGYALNLRLVRRFCNGLSHEASLRQPPFAGNCLNWVVGHLAVNRDRVLALLGVPPLLSDDERARYETGSDPVLGDGAGAAPLGRLLDILEQGQAQLDFFSR